MWSLRGSSGYKWTHLVSLIFLWLKKYYKYKLYLINIYSLRCKDDGILHPVDNPTACYCFENCSYCTLPFVSGI